MVSTRHDPVYTGSDNKLYKDKAATSEVGGAAAGSAHNVLSATHTDAFAADVPADKDVLTWVTANSRWEAVAPAVGQTPYLDVCVAASSVNAGGTIDVNSTTYVAPGVMSFPLDASIVNWTHFRIFIRGAGVGGDITTQLTAFATPATPLSAAGNDLVITSGVTAFYDSGWIAFATPPTTMQTLLLALKGAGATNDLTLFNAHVMFKYTP